MPVSVKTKGTLDKLATRLKPNTAKAVLVGIDATEAAEVAQYARYVEYGWVQRVTERQARFLYKTLPAEDKAFAPLPGASLVNPPRPFLRGTFAAEGKNWREVLMRSMGRDLFDLDLALTRVGVVAVEDIKQTIVRGGTSQQTFARRAPMTLALYEAFRRGRKGKGGNDTTDKPLVLSGVLLNSISFQLE